MQVCVIIDSNKFIFFILEPTDRILYLKAKIDEKLGIPYKQQEIFFQSSILDNDNTLDYYSIQDDSVLHLTTQSQISDTTKMRVLLKDLNTKNHTFHVSPKILVKDFKKMIYETMKVPKCQQRLVFAGKQLEDSYSF